MSAAPRAGGLDGLREGGTVHHLSRFTEVVGRPHKVAWSSLESLMGGGKVISKKDR
jgi:hypothetical protein